MVATYSPLLLVMTLGAVTGCSSVRTFEPGKLRTVGVAELNTGDTAERLFRDGQPTVVVVRAGEAIPIDLSLDVPFAKLSSGDQRLVFTRDTYVYVARDGMLIGFDGQRFAPVGDFKAVRKLAGGGHGGSFQIGASVTKEAGLRLAARAEAR